MIRMPTLEQAREEARMLSSRGLISLRLSDERRQLLARSAAAAARQTRIPREGQPLRRLLAVIF